MSHRALEKSRAPEQKSEAGVKKDRQLQVRALESGTVIDHLTPGTAFRTVRLLGLEGSTTVLVGAYLKSGRTEFKDLIKIEGRELTKEETNKIALLSPQATLSIIREFEVVQKIYPEVPDTIEGLIRCVNPSCITQDARAITRFQTESRVPLRLRCYYCERTFMQESIDFLGRIQ